MDDVCSVKQRQLETVEQILNFNQPVDRTSEFGGVGVGVGGTVQNFWKVLVYDDRGRDIVSPLLSVQDLRARGVTLHLNLHARRDVIGAVPAIYLCAPTDANVKRIARDVQDDLYAAYHLNFTQPVPRPLLEQLAALVMETGNAHKISKVNDQFVDFVSYDHRFFSLDLPDTLYQYSSPTANEAQIEELVALVANGLFAALVTMKVLPVIFCNCGGPSEAIARQLDEKIRNSLQNRNTPFSRLQFMSLDSTATVFGGKRPALVLLDRGVDLSAALRHTATYQALLEDTLPTTRTTVVIPADTAATSASEGAGGGGSEEAQRTVKYSLNKAHDDFWASHSDSEFHEAVEATTAQLKEVLAQEKEIRQRSGGGGGDDDGGVESDYAFVTFPFLISLYVLHGVARASFEGPNRATYVTVPVQHATPDGSVFVRASEAVSVGGRGGRSRTTKTKQTRGTTHTHQTRGHSLPHHMAQRRSMLVIWLFAVLAPHAHRCRC